MNIPDWKNKLDTFLKQFPHMPDVIGVLVCGSYITGNPGPHSDLDVHLVLRDTADYRQRGNKVIDGLLIEYFANPPKQILQYLKDDLAAGNLNSQVQFATGHIIQDTGGAVAALKAQALAQMDAFYQQPAPNSLFPLTKYGLWDSLDNLEEAFKTNRPDFDLIYFTSLDRLMQAYMQAIRHPYHTMAMYGHLTSNTVRGKYLLKELPAHPINQQIITAITASTKEEKLQAFQTLTQQVLEPLGGFEIDGFTFRSPLDVGPV